MAEDIKSFKLSLLYKYLLISIPANFICATLIFIGLIPLNKMFLSWYILVVVISILRLAMYFLYQRIQNYQLFFTIFSLGTFLSAALWGLADSVLMPLNAPYQEMIVIIIIAGVTAGGIQSLQASLINSCIYITTIIIPLCIWLFLHHLTTYYLISISMAAYFIFILGIAWRGSKVLDESINLRFHNKELMDKLAQNYHNMHNINLNLQMSENIFRNAMENAPIGMGIVSLSGRWQKVNNILCNMLGYTQDELLELTFQDITYPGDLDKSIEFANNFIHGKETYDRLEKRYVKKNGEMIWAMLSVGIVRDMDNKPQYFIAHIEDTTLEKQNKIIMSELYQKTQDMLTQLQFHTTVTAVINKMNEMLQTCVDLQEAYTVISIAAKKIFTSLSGGIAMIDESENELKTVAQWGKQQTLLPFFSTEGCWSLREGQIYLIKNPKQEIICNHFKNPPDNSYICLPLIVQSKILGILHFQGSLADITSINEDNLFVTFSDVIKLSLANIKLRENLKRQSIRDALTGLFNRRYLDETLPRELSRTVRENKLMCVAMLDLDFFKQFNDEYGHEAGDKVLELVGKILDKNCRESDIACRFGGEEFLVILGDTTLDFAVQKLELICEQIKTAKISFHERQLPPITVSVGIAEVPTHGSTSVDIIEAADKAMYQAKQKGRDRIDVFSS